MTQDSLDLGNSAEQILPIFSLSLKISLRQKVNTGKVNHVKTNHFGNCWCANPWGPDNSESSKVFRCPGPGLLDVWSLRFQLKHDFLV